MRFLEYARKHWTDRQTDRHKDTLIAIPWGTPYRHKLANDYAIGMSFINDCMLQPSCYTSIVHCFNC